MSIQDCTQVSEVARVWQITCCSEHTLARRRIRQLSAVVSAHKHVCMCCREISSGLVLPTKPCCESTHVCGSIGQMQVASTDQRFQLQGFGRPRAAATIHMCVAEVDQFQVAPKDHRLHGTGRPGQAVQGFGRPHAAVSTQHTHTHTHQKKRVWQENSAQGCTQG